MTGAERIVRCRYKATQAEEMGTAAPLDYKLRFYQPAAQWRRIADELEADPMAEKSETP